jgi:peroxiredoxin
MKLEEMMKIKKVLTLKIVLTITILAISTLLYLTFFSPNIFHKKVENDKPLILKTVQGREFHLSIHPNQIKIAELEGKIIFLKVFGWDCNYCEKEIPELIKLKNKFEGAFETIALEYQHHSNRKNLELIKEKGINYHLVNGDEHQEFLTYLEKEYKWKGVIPLTIVLNTDGKILAFEVGYKSYSLTSLLQRSLQVCTAEAIDPNQSKEHISNERNISK